MKTAILVCTPLKSSGTGSGRNKQWWKRDVYHIAQNTEKSYCNRDITEWLVIGPEEENEAITNHSCCTICARNYKKEYGL